MVDVKPSANCLDCGHKNPDEARFCNRCGTRLLAVEPADERRQLTVLFADLVGSTRHAANLDPEEWSYPVQLYQSVCQRCVAQFDGHIAQYLGDGVLVYFGYPVAYEDSAARALLCALSIRDRLYGINLQIFDRLGFDLQIRIGLHTGPVLLGKMGAGANSETLALGNTPNIAARLQGLAPPDGIAVSQSTLDLAGTAFASTGMGKQKLRGLDDSLEVALLEGLATTRAPADQTRFFGREFELDRLRNMWANAEFGAQEAVLITGEPGIGKSSLVIAFRAELQEAAHHWFRVDCSVFQASSPFAAIIAALSQQLIDTSDRQLERLSALDQRTQAAIYDVLKIAGHSKLPVISSQIEKRELFIDGVVELLATFAAEQPLVVCVEDLHWVDPSTLELLAKLTELKSSSMLLLMTARHEPGSTFDGLHRLNLEPLDAEDIAALIGDVLVDDQTADVEELAKRSDGIPLFAEELAKSFAGNLESIPQFVPASLQDLLRAQLDRLGPSSKMAHAAAILGRNFSRDLLLRITKENPDEATKQINQLLTERIFVESGTELLSFRHALIQEEAYSSILRRDRRRFHAEAATVLTDEFAATPPQVLAYHRSEADQPEVAARLWHKAAGQAKSAFAHQEALSHIRNGLAELEKLPESADRNRLEIRFQLGKGQALSSMRNFYDDDVTSAYQRAREISASIEDRETLFRTLASLQGASVTREHIEYSRELASQLTAMAATMSDVQFQVSAAELSGMTEYAAGNMRQAIELFRPITQRIEEAISLSVVGPISDFADAYLGPAFWVAGKSDQAISQAEAGLARVRSSDKTLRSANTLSCAAQVYTLCKDFDRAAALASELGVQSKEFEHRQHSLTARYLETIALGYSSGTDEPLAALLEFNERVKFDGLEGYFSWFQPDIGQLLINAGRVDEGLAVAERAIAVLNEFGGRVNLPPLLNLRAIALQKSDPIVAESAWLEALDIANDGGAYGWAKVVLDSFGPFLAERGRADELVTLKAALDDSIQR